MEPLDYLHRLAAASAAEFWFYVIALALAAVVGFYFSFHFFKRARLIEDTPTAKIRSAPQGYVELVGEGRLMPGPPIVAPLTGKSCLWYRYVVKKRQHRGRHSDWTVIDSGVSHELFHLVDGSGQCIIDPEGAEVHIQKMEVWYGAGYPMYGVRETGVWAWATQDYRYSEERLEINDDVHVIGEFTTLRGNPGISQLDADVRDMISNWKRNQAALLQRFDANRDGKLDLQEWEAARRVAYTLAAQEQAKRAGEPAAHVMRKPSDGRPFILSNYSQHALGARQQWYAAAAFLGCLITGTLAVWMIGIGMAVK